MSKQPTMSRNINKKPNFQGIVNNTETSCFNLLNQPKIYIETGNGNTVTTLCQVDNNYILYAISKETKINVYDISSKKHNTKGYIGHNSYVFKIMFIDKSLYSFSFNGEIILWNISNQSILLKNTINNNNDCLGMVTALYIQYIKCNTETEHEHVFCSSFWNLTVYVYTIHNVLYTIKQSPSIETIITTICYNYNENVYCNNNKCLLLASSRNKTVTLYQLTNTTYSEIKTINTSSLDDHNKYVTAFEVIPSRDRVIFGYNNGTILSLNIKLTKCIEQCKCHQTPICALEYFSDSNCVVSLGYKDKNIYIFKLDSFNKGLVIVKKTMFDCPFIRLNDGRLLSSNEGVINTIAIEDNKYEIKSEKKKCLVKEIN